MRSRGSRGDLPSRNLVTFKPIPKKTQINEPDRYAVISHDEIDVDEIISASFDPTSVLSENPGRGVDPFATWTPAARKTVEFRPEKCMMDAFDNVIRRKSIQTDSGISGEAKTLCSQSSFITKNNSKKSTLEIRAKPDIVTKIDVPSVKSSFKKHNKSTDITTAITSEVQTSIPEHHLIPKRSQAKPLFLTSDVQDSSISTPIRSEVKSSHVNVRKYSRGNNVVSAIYTDQITEAKPIFDVPTHKSSKKSQQTKSAIADKIFNDSARIEPKLSRSSVKSIFELPKTAGIQHDPVFDSQPIAGKSKKSVRFNGIQSDKNYSEVKIDQRIEHKTRRRSSRNQEKRTDAIIPDDHKQDSWKSKSHRKRNTEKPNTSGWSTDSYTQEKIRPDKSSRKTSRKIAESTIPEINGNSEYLIPNTRPTKTTVNTDVLVRTTNPITPAEARVKEALSRIRSHKPNPTMTTNPISEPVDAEIAKPKVSKKRKVLKSVDQTAPSSLDQPDVKINADLSKKKSSRKSKSQSRNTDVMLDVVDPDHEHGMKAQIGSKIKIKDDIEAKGDMLYAIKTK